MMLTTIESRLWLAVHLLYPNSSQAFDIYQAVIQQHERDLGHEKRALVFSKLAQVFEKISPVSSNLSFYEFEFDQIDQWKVIYKNSQKVQLLIFVGMLIFELKISEIAPAVHLTQEKTQFLFHQIFKKLAQSTSKLKYNEQLHYKKQNDQKVSYLYTYENLVDFCLGHLPEAEAEKVKLGLKLYPVLQTTQVEYQKIISQIQNLKVQKSAAFIPHGQPDPAQVPPVPKKSVFKDKKIMAALAVTLTIGAVSLQLSGMLNRLLTKDKTIVMQQVEKKAEPLPEVAVGSVPAPSTEPAVEPEPAPAPEPEPEAEPAKTEAAAGADSDQAAKAEGGLYRGSLIVENLSITNKKLIESVKKLGAKKAGEVELGWLRAPGMAYYHFTIPESNVDELKNFFKGSGSFHIKFENHPRLVPAGNKRFIIEVKQKE